MAQKRERAGADDTTKKIKKIMKKISDLPMEYFSARMWIDRKRNEARKVGGIDPNRIKDALDLDNLKKDHPELAEELELFVEILGRQYATKHAKDEPQLMSIKNFCEALKEAATRYSNPNGNFFRGIINAATGSGKGTVLAMFVAIKFLPKGSGQLIILDTPGVIDRNLRSLRELLENTKVNGKKFTAERWDESLSPQEKMDLIKRSDIILFNSKEINSLDISPDLSDVRKKLYKGSLLYNAEMRLHETPLQAQGKKIAVKLGLENKMKGAVDYLWEHRKDIRYDKETDEPIFDQELAIEFMKRLGTETGSEAETRWRKKWKLAAFVAAAKEIGRPSGHTSIENGKQKDYMVDLLGIAVADLVDSSPLSALARMYVNHKRSKGLKLLLGRTGIIEASISTSRTQLEVAYKNAQKDGLVGILEATGNNLDGKFGNAIRAIKGADFVASGNSVISTREFLNGDLKSNLLVTGKNGEALSLTDSNGEPLPITNLPHIRSMIEKGCLILADMTKLGTNGKETRGHDPEAIKLSLLRGLEVMQKEATNGEKYQLVIMDPLGEKIILIKDVRRGFDEKSNREILSVEEFDRGLQNEGRWKVDSNGQPIGEKARWSVYVSRGRGYGETIYARDFFNGAKDSLVVLADDHTPGTDISQALARVRAVDTDYSYVNGVRPSKPNGFTYADGNRVSEGIDWSDIFRVERKVIVLDSQKKTAEDFLSSAEAKTDAFERQGVGQLIMEYAQRMGHIVIDKMMDGTGGKELGVFEDLQKELYTADDAARFDSLVSKKTKYRDALEDALNGWTKTVKEFFTSKETNHLTGKEKGQERYENLSEENKKIVTKIMAGKYDATIKLTEGSIRHEDISVKDLPESFRLRTKKHKQNFSIEATETPEEFALAVEKLLPKDCLPEKSPGFRQGATLSKQRSSGRSLTRIPLAGRLINGLQGKVGWVGKYVQKADDALFSTKSRLPKFIIGRDLVTAVFIKDDEGNTKLDRVDYEADDEENAGRKQKPVIYNNMKLEPGQWFNPKNQTVMRVAPIANDYADDDDDDDDDEGDEIDKRIAITEKIKADSLPVKKFVPHKKMKPSEDCTYEIYEAKDGDGNVIINEDGTKQYEYVMTRKEDHGTDLEESSVTVRIKNLEEGEEEPISYTLTATTKTFDAMEIAYDDNKAKKGKVTVILGADEFKQKARFNEDLMNSVLLGPAQNAMLGEALRARGRGRARLINDAMKSGKVGFEQLQALRLNIAEWESIRDAFVENQPEEGEATPEELEHFRHELEYIEGNIAQGQGMLSSDTEDSDKNLYYVPLKPDQIEKFLNEKYLKALEQIARANGDKSKITVFKSEEARAEVEKAYRALPEGTNIDAIIIKAKKSMRGKVIAAHSGSGGLDREELFKKLVPQISGTEGKTKISKKNARRSVDIILATGDKNRRKLLSSKEALQVQFEEEGFKPDVAKALAEKLASLPVEGLIEKHQRDQNNVYMTDAAHNIDDYLEEVGLGDKQLSKVERIKETIRHEASGEVRDGSHAQEVAYVRNVYEAVGRIKEGDKKWYVPGNELNESDIGKTVGGHTLTEQDRTDRMSGIIFKNGNPKQAIARKRKDGMIEDISAVREIKQIPLQLKDNNGADVEVIVNAALKYNSEGQLTDEKGHLNIDFEKEAEVVTAVPSLGIEPGFTVDLRFNTVKDKEGKAILSINQEGDAEPIDKAKLEADIPREIEGRDEPVNLHGVF